MSARAIVSGVLFKAPQAKVSKAEKPYVLATIREGTGERTRWWKVFIFSESACEEALRLGDGEPIAVAGEFDCELYAPEGGAARLSWKLTADAVLSARRKPKVKSESTNRQPQAASGREAAAKSWAAPRGMGGDDDGEHLPL
jgi:hypothetical protein